MVAINAKVIYRFDVMVLKRFFATCRFGVICNLRFLLTLKKQGLASKHYRLRNSKLAEWRSASGLLQKENKKIC